MRLFINPGGGNMKIIYLECNEEELKINRTLLDAFQDIGTAIVNAFNTPVSDDLEKRIQELSGGEKQEDEE